MRTLRFLSILKYCRVGVLFFLLAISPAGFGQTYGPWNPIVVGPMVRIISPANHSFFLSPVNIPILAYVVDSPYTTNVEFYANGVDLGHGFSLGASNRPPETFTPQIVLPSIPIARLLPVYCLVWSNVPPGAYALTAVARERTNIYLPPDDYGYTSSLSKTSAPVNITVIPRVPPPTNTLPMVSILATDPIAIVGSNSWVWPGVTNATPTWTNWPPPNAISFTNWGPKDALFTVRRFGEDTNAITVTYSISGTASNGVDYVQLPGYATLPIGQDCALIPVVPIDHGPPYSIPKTVVLTLTPSTTSSPSYIIGIPRKATALIIHEWPRPLPLLLSDGSFHVNAPGPDGAWFVVESSPDLQNWSPVCTNQVVQGSIDFVDANAPSNAHLFYQAAPQNTPPSQ